MRCYACGKELEKTFVLVTYDENTDRVFLFCDDCEKRAESPIRIKVKLTED